MSSHFGRDEAQWSELVDVTERFLASHARNARLSSYTELNTVLEQRTGQPRFNFDRESDRAAIGAVLGEVALRSLSTGGFLLSSIVIYLNENDAGEGFYRLAADHSLLPRNASRSQRDQFWTTQVSAAFAHYALR